LRSFEEKRLFDELLKGSSLHKIFPFLGWWPSVNKGTLKSDLLAGLTGAIVVLPQGVAFSMIAGLPPIYGLYTAMITPIVAALFGSSHHLVSGPTTTISIAIYASISMVAKPATDEFISTVLTLTIIVGTIQFLFGVVKMGALVNFVSRSVITGYTTGAALLIVTNQLKHVIGIPMPHESFLGTWKYFFQHIMEVNSVAVLIGLSTILVALLTKKFLSKAPHFLVAMIFGGALIYLLKIDSSIVALVGEMPSGLPPFRIPALNFELVRELIPSAFAVATLGLIEVVSISRSIATKSQQHLNSNQEFIGLGLSNIVGGLFSCYAGSGSFTRSGLNYSAGAKTPMAAIFAAFLLMLVMILFAPLAAYLPMATMGGIIMIVAYNLIDWPHIRHLFQLSKTETAVVLITFFSTLFLGLVFAIFSGIIFSLTFYLMRTSKPKMVLLAPHIIEGRRKFMNAELHGLDQCPQVHIIRIDGSLFFGAVENIKSALIELSRTKKHILIVGSGINFIDASGAELLLTESKRLQSMGGGLYFSHLKKSVRDYLDKGYKEKIGASDFFFHKEDAIQYIYSKLDRSICDQCKVRIFTECNTQSK
jgi:SulP family sulfate permease